MMRFTAEALTILALSGLALVPQEVAARTFLLAQSANGAGTELTVIALTALKELGSIAAVLAYAWWVTTKALPHKDERYEKMLQTFMDGLVAERTNFDRQIESLIKELNAEREDNRTAQRSLELAIRDMVRSCTYAQRACATVSPGKPNTKEAQEETR